MKQPLPIIIGVVLIAIVAFFAFRSDDTDDTMLEETPLLFGTPETAPYAQTTPDVAVGAPITSSVAPEAGSVNISIDDQGFDPAIVTIPVGTTVVFTNNGQALHWPASDPHPTHTDLPSFDAKKGLATGAMYSYTFTEKGTFGMHDSLNTKMKGSIVVQ